MTPKRGRPSAPRAHRPAWTGWLGLAWVWSGLLWAFGALSLWSAGDPGDAGVTAFRLLLTVALGVGLCAGENWAWAWAVCQCVLYLVLAGALAVAAGSCWLMLPASALSWKPVFLGLTPAATGWVALGALGVATLSAGMLVPLLWEKAHFDVPYRRTFTLLLRSGLGPVLLSFAVDFYLLVEWWPLVRR